MARRFRRRVLRSRREFDFERMVFLESANTEHAKTDNMAFFVYAFHHRIAFSRPHVAVRVRKSHFEVIHFRVKPQFQFIAHDIPPASARSQSAPRSRSTTTNPRSCPRLTAIAKMLFFAVAVRIARPPSRWNAALAEYSLGIGLAPSSATSKVLVRGKRSSNPSMVAAAVDEVRTWKN